MNVLVYSGPEVLQSSLTRSISLLRSLLLPNYTVQPITLQSLAAHPWSTNCALLVFPACRDYLSLSLSASNPIKSYVENGGAFLGIRAGARTSRSGLTTLVDPSEYTIRFQDRASGSSVYCTFATGSDEPIQSVDIKSANGEDIKGVLQTITPSFEGTENATNAHILARYSEGGVAAASYRVGEGKVVLYGIHVEAPIVPGEHPALSPEEIYQFEERRRNLIKDTLQLFGLRLPSNEPPAYTQPLPQILSGTPSNPEIIHQIVGALDVKPSSKIADGNDTFVFHNPVQGTKLLQEARTSSIPQDVKYIIVYANSELPVPSDTPLFNISQYYADLASARTKTGCPTHPESWGVGEALLYGEAVTSTQTMLDRNPRLLSTLPTPLLSLASCQLAGRGRGGNAWVSPSGCLQFSLLLRVPLTQLPAQKLVFIQYLFALAVVEACRSEDVLGSSTGQHVRVKWPNDIYVVDKDDRKRKIGGILVHTSFSGGVVTIVIGCGLNVLNPPPIASLAQLIPQGETRHLSMERTAAVIMATFEPMWNTLVAQRGSFDPFMDLYLNRWLHSDQLVTITTTTPHRQVRITGITSDYGLLRTVPERDRYSSSASGGALPEYIDLQPDGNTFDLMSGLIMTKSSK